MKFLSLGIIACHFYLAARDWQAWVESITVERKMWRSLRCAHIEGQRQAGLRNLEAALGWLSEQNPEDQHIYQARFERLVGPWQENTNSCEGQHALFEISLYQQNKRAYAVHWPNWHYRIAASIEAFKATREH